MKESAVISTIKGFLEAHGWRAVRMQRTVWHGEFQTGEPGIADYVFLHYRLPAILWIEFKKPGAVARCSCVANMGTRKRCTACDQKQWRMREAARGGEVWTVDSFEFFERLYQAAYGAK